MGCVINSDNAFDCSALEQGGITPRLLFYNWEDWILNSVTRDVDGTITAITNATGKEAYDFSGADSGSVIPSCVLRAVDGGADGYDHQIDARVYNRDNAGLTNASKFRFAKVVAIIERVDGKAELYGEGVGMRMSDFQYQPGSSDRGGIAGFVLKTHDNDAPENQVPVIIDAGTQALTRTLLDGLTTAGA